MEVQVRLRGQEIVHVILPPGGVPFPGWPAEHRQPVVRRGAVGLGIGPDIPVRLGIGARQPAFGEPGMLVGRMRDHLVDDDLEPQRMGLLHQVVEILQRAESGVDIAIVGDVVAEVAHGRGEYRRQPDGVNAQIGNIVEATGDTHQIANAIAVLILKGARVDLIDYRATPPILIEDSLVSSFGQGHVGNGIHGTLRVGILAHPLHRARALRKPVSLRVVQHALKGPVAGLGGALLGLVVHVYDAEALAVAFGPLVIVEQ